MKKEGSYDEKRQPIMKKKISYNLIELNWEKEVA